jgi:RHS repeat-associated protein
LGQLFQVGFGFGFDPVGLGNVVGEYDDAGNLLARYDHALVLKSRTEAGSNPAYYAFDAIGNVQQLITAAGFVANAYAYTPFGRLLRRAEAISNPFQFVGEPGVTRESTGLYSMRRRGFDEAIGRFQSEDSSRIYLHLRNANDYFGNNPISYVDPLGLWRMPDWLRSLPEVLRSMLFSAGNVSEMVGIAQLAPVHAKDFILLRD